MKYFSKAELSKLTIALYQALQNPETRNVLVNFSIAALQAAGLTVMNFRTFYVVAHDEHNVSSFILIPIFILPAAAMCYGQMLNARKDLKPLLEKIQKDLRKLLKYERDLVYTELKYSTFQRSCQYISTIENAIATGFSTYLLQKLKLFGQMRFLSGLQVESSLGMYSYAVGVAFLIGLTRTVYFLCSRNYKESEKTRSLKSRILLNILVSAWNLGFGFFNATMYVVGFAHVMHSNGLTSPGVLNFLVFSMCSIALGEFTKNQTLLLHAVNAYKPAESALNQKLFLYGGRYICGGNAALLKTFFVAFSFTLVLFGNSLPSKLGDFVTTALFYFLLIVLFSAAEHLVNKISIQNEGHSQSDVPALPAINTDENQLLLPRPEVNSAQNCNSFFQVSDCIKKIKEKIQNCFERTAENPLHF